MLGSAAGAGRGAGGCCCCCCCCGCPSPPMAPSPPSGPPAAGCGRWMALALLSVPTLLAPPQIPPPPRPPPPHRLVEASSCGGCCLAPTGEGGLAGAAAGAGAAATAQEEPGLTAALPGAPRGEGLRAALGVLAPQALRGGAPICASRTAFSKRELRSQGVPSAWCLTLGRGGSSGRRLTAT